MIKITLKDGRKHEFARDRFNLEMGSRFIKMQHVTNSTIWEIFEIDDISKIEG